MTLTTRLYSAIFGQQVGQDAFGNRYYRRRGSAGDKRWVIYKGKAEPSKVPAEWHGWLHYTFDAPPMQRGVHHHTWEKQHLPNLTGTPGAYLPPGHLLKGAARDEAAADYEAWKP